MARSPAPSAPSIDRDWEAEDDLRTLKRARDVATSSTRLAGAKRIARKELKALRSIAGTSMRAVK